MNKQDIDKLRLGILSDLISNTKQYLIEQGWTEQAAELQINKGLRPFATPTHSTTTTTTTTTTTGHGLQKPVKLVKSVSVDESKLKRARSFASLPYHESIPGEAMAKKEMEKIGRVGGISGSSTLQPTGQADTVLFIEAPPPFEPSISAARVIGAASSCTEAPLNSDDDESDDESSSYNCTSFIYGTYSFEDYSSGHQILKLHDCIIDLPNGTTSLVVRQAKAWLKR